MAVGMKEMFISSHQEKELQESLRFKKGAFGFPEAPCLWWLEFRDVFGEACFTPSKRHPATFYLCNRKSEYR